MKSKISFFVSIVLAFAVFAGFAGSAEAQVKVACIGDSITWGFGLDNPATQSYPAQLQTLLGNQYVVGNFGVNGATAQKSTSKSYWRTSQFRNSKQFAPNIVVIMLGTNDSRNWNAVNFNTDLKALVFEYQALPTRPRVYLCLIPPVYIPNAFGNTFDPAFVQGTVVPAIRTIASQAGVTLIDNNTPLLNRPDYFSDGVHPTIQGTAIIAATVYGPVKQP